MMAVYNWWMVIVATKEEWSFAATEFGQRSGIVSGITTMPELFAGNWNMMISVRPHTITLLAQIYTCN